MRFLHLLLLICAIAGAVFNLPQSFLPASWQSGFEFWRAERVRSFQSPSASSSDFPESEDVTVESLDIDQVCPPDRVAWREARVIDGIAISASEDCRPDNPWDIAASVKGTNNVSVETLHRSLLAPDAIEKSDDRDGDGDPDLIEIRLEVMELNGKSPEMPEVVPQFEIAPGITPGLWVFAPKTRGMTTENFESLIANRLIRLPGPAIRVEQGDEVRITLENSHYLPHTIHFHGVDHPFKTPQGEGNDGVPVFSEHPVMPGEKRTYWMSPRHAGTMFYHCHVQPQAHILMGLQGMFIIEEQRPNNWLQTFNIGGGRVRVSSKAVAEEYDREFDLHYLEIDRELNNRIQQFNDPRLLSKAIHRGYNVTQRKAEYYTLNGQSFPYTMRESLIITEPDKRYKLRVLNGGGEGLALHIHGHKPRLTHRDGVALPPEQYEQRDVFWLASAQRLDLALNTRNDGLNAYGEGAWLVHDHRESAVTTNGIGPGGGVSVLAYPNYLSDSGLPKTVHGLQNLALFFSPKYYQGEIPVFTGMGDFDLGELSTSSGNAKESTWIFWFSVFALVILLLLIPKVWRGSNA